VKKELLGESDFLIAAVSQRNLEWKYGANRDALENNYIEYYENQGIQLLPIPNALKNPKKYLESFPQIKAVILSGGNMIDARLYKKKNKKESDFSEKRDSTEIQLLEYAIKKDLPVLGICRGMQLINIYFGGSLEEVQNHVRKNHEIIISNKGLISEFGTDKIKVNSFHHKGITRKSLSNELVCFAETKETTIEGLFHPKHAIAGIEWHPERMRPKNKFNKKLIELFKNRKSFWRKRK